MATAVFRLTETPHSAEALVAALEASFGGPEEGTAADATRTVLAELVAAGVLRVAPGGVA